MELYRNELGVVSVGLPAGSSAITAQMINETTVSLAGVNYNPTSSIASVNLPFSATSYDHEFDVKFNFTIGAEIASITEHVTVVTGVLTRARAEILCAGKYAEVEPIVRKVIEAYTGQSFGKWTGTYRIFGESEAELQLPQRLISLATLDYNGVTENVASYQIKRNRYFLSKKRYGLTVKEAPPEESIEYTVPGGQTIFYPFRSEARFGEDIEYSVSGVWGWESVPVDVQKAAEVLFSDYVCNEATYRNRYVQDVSAQDWKIRFSGRTWDGTGNVIADQLLDKFRLSGMAII